MMQARISILFRTLSSLTKWLSTKSNYQGNKLSQPHTIQI